MVQNAGAVIDGAILFACPVGRVGARVTCCAPVEGDATSCYGRRVAPPETRTDFTRELYLDLLKRTLTGAVAEDNDSILGGVRTAGSTVRRKALAHGVGRALNRFGFELTSKKPYDPEL